MKKFDSRFEGPANAGIRKKIREVVSDWYAGDMPDYQSPGEAVKSLRNTIALTASGLHTLCEVASDYNNVWDRGDRVSP